MVAVFVATNLVDGVWQRKPNQESLGGIVFKPAGHRVAGFVRHSRRVMRQLNGLKAQPNRLSCQRQLPLGNEPSGELNMDGQDGQDVFW